jgi:APA family basic amino acid/polyamine antiporter
MRGMFAVKNLDDILKDAEAPEQSLRRALGPVHVTLLGVGAIIGAGIFATIGTAAAGDPQRVGAGPALVLSFGIAGLVCAVVALCYAEIAAMVPIAGSAYTYSYATLGEVIAWIIGWDLIIEYGVGNVAVAISWANYFKTLFREIGIIIPDWLSTDYHTAQRIPGLLENAPHILGVPIVINLLAIAIIAVITIILLIGIRESAWFNAGMVMLKLIVLTFFVIVSWKAIDSGNWTPFMPNGWIGVFKGAAVIFFAYIGFDAVSTAAEETRNPQRNLPIGIIASLIICTLFYILIAAVFTGMIPYSQLKNLLATQQAEPLTIAMEYANIRGTALKIVAAGSVIAHTAVLFVFQLGQTRIFFSMSRDGLLPAMFRKVHPRFRTPWGSTILTGLGVGIFTLFTSLEEMVDLTNIGTLFAFSLVCIGVIVLRKKDPDRPRPFRVPFGIGLPMIATAGCLFLIGYLPPTSWLRFSAWLSVGVIVYVLYGSVKSRLTGRHLAKDPAVHDSRTSWNGTMLAMTGIILMFLTHFADLARKPGKTEAGWFFDTSPWLVVPLFLYVLVLFPVIILRANRAKAGGVTGIDLINATKASNLSLTLLLFTAAYLVCVFVFLR